MTRSFFVLLFLLLPRLIFSQQTYIKVLAPTKSELPYRTIPKSPETYTPANVVARMIDGLGFRFYWATEGLRASDLAFRPTPEARSNEETVDHILGLTNVILNAIKNQPNLRTGEETSPLTFDVKRKMTLEALKEASDLLQQADFNLEKESIIFQNKTGKVEYPFWNVIYGPISDALWHVGQVVTFRRSSGNPINGKVNFLTGTVKE